MIHLRNILLSGSKLNRGFSHSHCHSANVLKVIGGRSEEKFRHMCEKSSKYISDVLSPKIVSLEKGSLTMILPFKKDFIGNPLIPCLHGGIAASMLDHVSGFCGWTALDDANAYLATADMRVDYLLPAPCEDLYFEATILHQSYKLIRVDSICYNKDKTKKLALGRGLFNVYRKEKTENSTA